MAVLWIGFWLYWLTSALRAKRSVRDQSYWISQAAWRLVIIFLVVLILKVPELRRFFLEGQLFPANLAIESAGVLLCAVGMAFAVWARVHIGKNWGMPMSIREEPELVTSGPYQLVRHPIYTGIMAALLGTALVVSKIWLLIIVVSFPYFIYSAIKEEKLMTRQFPEQYPEYKKRSKMLVPFLF